MKISKTFATYLASAIFPRKEIIGISVFLIVFYFIGLGGFPLFTPDEARYSEIAREMVVSGDYVVPRVNGVPFFDKPIFYYWLQSLAIRWLGVNEWSLRFFPALIGIASCLLVFASGKYLFDRRTGFIASLLLATTPLYFASAHYADLNLEVAFFMSAALLCFICGWKDYFFSLENRRYSLIIASFVFAGLAVLTKGLIGVVLPGLIVSSWMLWLRRLYWSTWLYAFGVLIFASIVLPWFFLIQATHPTFFHYFFVVQHVSRFLARGDFNNQMPVWFYLPVVIGGFFPWSLFLWQALSFFVKKIWNLPKLYPVELFLLLWIVIIFAFFSIPHSKLIGYILPIFPPLALVVARYLSLSWENIKTDRLRRNYFYLAGGSLLLAAILWDSAYNRWFDISSKFLPYLKIISSLWLLTAVFTIFLLTKPLRFSNLMRLCFLSVVISLLLLVKGASYLNLNTAKRLTSYLNAVRGSNEVILYYKYYYDIPLYLQQQVKIVANWDEKNILLKDNWLREFSLGKKIENTSEWLIEEKSFWEKWQSTQTIFVFINENYLPQFKQHADYYFILGRQHDIFLLSNFPLNVSSVNTQKFNV